MTIDFARIANSGYLGKMVWAGVERGQTVDAAPPGERLSPHRSPTMNCKRAGNSVIFKDRWS